jgi:hypothetical protein
MYCLDLGKVYKSYVQEYNCKTEVRFGSKTKITHGKNKPNENNTKLYINISEPQKECFIHAEVRMPSTHGSPIWLYHF